MPSVTEILSEDNEQMPECLRHAGTVFDSEMIDNFFSSRVVYYPGAGQHGRTFALFGATHSAHCFLHIDLSYSAEQIRGILNSGGNTSVRGYTPLSEVIPLDPFARRFGFETALWTILERRPDYSDDHGPKRLAFLHIQAEAVWFCSKVCGRLDKKSFGVVLQDHGFGGVNGHPAKFGGDKPLRQVVQTTAFAKYLLVGDGTPPWPQYEPISELTEQGYGQHKNQVRLYRQG